MFNRGVAQGQLNLHEAAIATYDEVVSHCDEAKPALREPVARALLNKGIRQSRLNQHEAAVATYTDVVCRFDAATEPALRKHVAMALNSRGFDRLIQAKTLGLQSDISQKYLRLAIADFDLALARFTPPSGFILGNRAYALHLLGQSPLAEKDFANALRSKERGGQFLYEATLKDLEMHKIPEDTPMRELVERTWAAFQHEQAVKPLTTPAQSPH